MSETFVALNGLIASRVVLCGADTGPPWAEVDLESDAPANGAAVLQVGKTQIKGTIDPGFSGTFALQRRCRFVAGGNGWGKILGSKCYHNDAGIKARSVAEDAAREAGETLGTFSPEAEKLGHDYIRQTGTASRALELAGGSLSWWVDFAGVTHLGTRPTVKADPKKYDVHHFNPITKTAQLGIDELDVWVGSTLSEGLDVPMVVRDIEVTITGGTMRTRVVLSEKAGTKAAIEDLFRAIVRRIVDEKLHGLYAYRVLSMGPDGRVSLQAVRKAAGLPDLLPVRMWPGVAGAHAKLTKSAIVGVQFLEGDPKQPRVTSFEGIQGGSKFVPETLYLGAADPADALEVVYKGCTIKVLTPPAAFSGTINGLPAAGVVVWPSSFTLGVAETGTPRVKVGPT